MVVGGLLCILSLFLWLLLAVKVEEMPRGNFQPMAFHLLGHGHV